MRRWLSVGSAWFFSCLCSVALLGGMQLFEHTYLNVVRLVVCEYSSLILLSVEWIMVLVMGYREIRAKRRKAILDGIVMNYSYNEIAGRIGIRRRVLIRDINAMRRVRDPEFLEAEREAEAKVDAEKDARSQTFDDDFFELTGMTLREKTFQNMVSFYRPELIKVLGSDDQLAAIRKLPGSVRKTLMRNNILVKQGSFRVSKNACEQLL